LQAQNAVILARTRPSGSDRFGGLSLFLIDLDPAHVEMRPIPKLPHNAVQSVQRFVHDLPVPEDRLVGESHDPITGVVDGGAAFYNIYRLHDGGHAVIGAIEPAFWREFCDRVGRPDWIARQGDPLLQRALINEVRAFFETLTRGTC
jgi:CoA-transferase family III